MKRTLALASVTVAISCGPVFAADLPNRLAPPIAPPIFVSTPWTGFYLGVNGGYGFGRSGTTASPFQNFAAPAQAVPAFALSQNTRGAVFGGQLGYNYQISNVVIGIEGDFDGTGINGSKTSVVLDPLNGAGGTATDSFTEVRRVDWLATVRGRLGYAFGSGLLYATGGVAFEHYQSNIVESTDTLAAVFSTTATASYSGTKTGFVIGGGYEYAIAPNWTLRGEYLHYQFGGVGPRTLNVQCGVGGAGAACGSNIRSSGDRLEVFRLGVNYKFDFSAPTPVVARY